MILFQEGFMLTNGVVPNLNNTYEPNNPELAKQCVRGERAVTEMLNRQGMKAQADHFFCSQPCEVESYYPYFRKQISDNRHKLPTNPTEREYIIFAHEIFDIYRKEIVEKACYEVEANLSQWTFSEQEWKQKKPLFQDFIWSYAKIVWSGTVTFALGEAMKKEFPVLPKDFWPSLTTVILPSEQENTYPNS